MFRAGWETALSRLSDCVQVVAHQQQAALAHRRGSKINTCGVLGANSDIQTIPGSPLGDSGGNLQQYIFRQSNLDGRSLRLCSFMIADPPAADFSTKCHVRKGHRFVFSLLLATSLYALDGSGWISDAERNQG